MISKKTNNNWGYQDLMQYRIHEILLVSSPYDAFILEEDGKLTEQILSEYIGMNLSYAPRVWNAQSAKEATEFINKRFFDVIIIMMRISDTDPIKFSQNIKKKYPKKPLVLLAFDQSELKDISLHDQEIFDEIFIWSGNSNVFPAAIKSIEDKKNIAKDVKTADRTMTKMTGMNSTERKGMSVQQIAENYQLKKLTSFASYKSDSKAINKIFNR